MYHPSSYSTPRSATPEFLYYKICTLEKRKLFYDFESARNQFILADTCTYIEALYIQIFTTADILSLDNTVMKSKPNGFRVFIDISL